ncbi:inositol monophosphatase ttx-7-like [Scaptodrosophila lebanonensis]|uniref:Inositol-1-monophosphatase n=1 Tax=Drosophila lebanonensis TaxID=7225 RepID=A0A6J2UFX8_DROLE|nr:inositol monophosphatase ttx-7-like [Scaptodrosophila lebanonensis]
MLNKITEEQLKAYHNVALQLVVKCGPIFREGYNRTGQNVVVKDDFVTAYGRQIAEILAQGLKDAFPESIIIEQGRVEITDAPTWFIDPIDGKTNYIHGLALCAISVGLSIGKQLVSGIVFNPVTNELFSAWKGHGAYLNGQPIHVTKTSKISDAIVGHEITLINAEAFRDKNVKRGYKLAAVASCTRCFGSAAISLTYLAKGSLDVYQIDDLEPWNVAAGVLILQEAGGVIYNSNGGDFDIIKPNFVCAATKELAQEVLQLIQEADQITDYTFK